MLKAALTYKGKGSFIADGGFHHQIVSDAHFTPLLTLSSLPPPHHKYTSSVSKTRAIYASSDSDSKTEYHICVMKDHAFADRVWSRLLNKTSSGVAAAIEKFIQREPGVEAALGLTHRIRLLRYQDGDRFDPHFDRIVTDEQAGQESLITVLIYLNDGDGKDFAGGETVFLDSQDPIGNDKSKVAVVPKAGRVVLFEHGLYHAGAPLKNGEGGLEGNDENNGNDPIPQRKYIIRTDVMFPIRPAWAR